MEYLISNIHGVLHLKEPGTWSNSEQKATQRRLPWGGVEHSWGITRHCFAGVGFYDTKRTWLLL